MEETSLEYRYLERLSERYPTIASAATEIINLQSILNLPKGTEHFLTDIHGEYEAFDHVLRNGSGSVRRKIEDVFGNTLSDRDKRSLATLIYYPQEKMDLVRKEESDIKDWYRMTLYRLIEVSKRAASKYTRSKVRKSLPKDYAYVIEELITEKAEVLDKEAYYSEIVNTIIDIERAESFIVALCELIQRLVVDHLHIVGDIYDRGPGPHFIMDKLMEYHSIDIQWGNHDMLWMGAAAGQRSCIANVIRICIRYSNLDILEDAYGINMLPLANFAQRTYEGDPCKCFQVKNGEDYNDIDRHIAVLMHKAITVIQFKLEGQLIKRHKDFEMEDRLLLDKINYDTGMINCYGKEYKMLDMNFPTVDPKNPYALTEEEEDIIERLQKNFMNCTRLQKHMRFLLSNGNLYKIYNGNLLYHGCVPLNEDGSFREVNIYGKKYSGKKLYDVLESYVRKGFFSVNPGEQEKGRDLLWFIWENPGSPLFGKDRMTTFERQFIAEKETHVEKKNPYYRLLENEDVVKHILDNFGLEDEDAHIINGHIPVHQTEGEKPMKCNGRVLVIDGGFSKAYQSVTGIAGYTLIYNSYGMRLVAHEPFESREAAIEHGLDIHSETVVVQRVMDRRSVGDTDNGVVLKQKIEDLKILLEAYRNGDIRERQ